MKRGSLKTKKWSRDLHKRHYYSNSDPNKKRLPRTYETASFYVIYAKASGYIVLAFCNTELEILDDAKKRIAPKNKKPVKNNF